MQLSDFDYHLPTELIAQYPLPKRSESKLMYVNHGTIQHFLFKDIRSFFREGDLIILNDTKVIPARLFGQKKTGGKVELLVERVLDEKRLLVQLRVSKSPKIGHTILINHNIELLITSQSEKFFELTLVNSDEKIWDIIERNGTIPLPPYMHRKPNANDNDRYQTVYASAKGSVAAPTAGLHFDAALLQALRANRIQFASVTLHIGAGTFSPVRVENILEHKMHSEFVTVSEDVCHKINEARRQKKRIVAVGTTTLRALESAYQGNEINPFQGDTNIFIYPGYEFKSVDALITNFHLPCSTLLMLVCAFGGYADVMNAYHEAIKNQYRFYSYGDAMLIERE